MTQMHIKTLTDNVENGDRDEHGDDVSEGATLLTLPSIC